MLTYDEHGNVVRDKIILTRGTLRTIIDTIKSEIAHAYKWLFPVGFIWSTSKAPTNGGDPNDLFPGTTWVRLEGAFICAAGDNDTVDSDPEHDTPHGSDTRNGSQLPRHKHPLNGGTGKTSSSGSSSGTLSRLLFDKSKESSLATGIFSASNISGSWYGTNYVPNNTGHCSVDTYIIGNSTYTHAHVIASKTSDSLPSTMDIQPKRFYKYYWERTA